MRNSPITILESDATRLRELLAARARAKRDQDHVHELAVELERANIVAPHEAPEGLIAMNVRVRVLDVGTAERRDIVLVYPNEADLDAGRISVLAPLGTALLGYREGDDVEWLMPGGLRRLRIERVRRPVEAEDARARPGELLAAAAG